jgi:hypothetical protein
MQGQRGVFSPSTEPQGRCSTGHSDMSVCEPAAEFDPRALRVNALIFPSIIGFGRRSDRLPILAPTTIRTLLLRLVNAEAISMAARWCRREGK